MASKRIVHRHKVTPDQIRSVILLSAQTPPPPSKWSVRQIAKELGMSKTSVQDILKPRVRKMVQADEH